jgi:tellurite resistance protein TerC
MHVLFGLLNSTRRVHNFPPMESPDPESPFWKALKVTYKSARRIVIGVVGVTIVLVGIAMLVLPGPAFIVIPTGFAVLGAEFAFARRWLRVLKVQARNGLNSLGVRVGSNGRRRASKRASEQRRAGGAPEFPEQPNFAGDAAKAAVDDAAQDEI